MEKQLPTHTSDAPVAVPYLSCRDRIIAGLGHGLRMICFCVATYLFLNIVFLGAKFEDIFFWPTFRCHESTPEKLADSQKVRLEAHVMSKCPDARDCLRQLVVPTMEQVNDLVDFDLSFIAT